MNKLFIDTDVLIDFSHGKSHLLENILKEKQTELFINPVIIAEFFTDEALKGEKKEKAIEFFTHFTVLEITGKIGFLAGELLQSRKTNFLGDALVAGTCLANQIPLLTRNKKHFTKVPNLLFYSPTSMKN